MTGEWRTIETAPLDGTPVLLCGGSYWCDWQRTVHEPAVAKWVNSEGQPDKWDKRWTIAAAEAGYTGAFYNNPTHWMPLPEPPRRPRPVIRVVLGKDMNGTIAAPVPR